MENKDIKIEFDEISYPRPSQGNYTLYHYGTLFIGDKEYVFTLAEMYDGNADYADFETTWVDETPEDSTNLELKIEDAYEDEYSKLEQEETDNDKAFKRSQN